MIQAITKMQKSKYRKFFDVILILLGTLCMSAPVKLIYEPMKMVMGGFGGFAIVVKYFAEGFGLDIPVWLTNAVLNIPVFIIAFFVIGKDFVAKTLLGAVSFAVWLYIIPTYDICGGDFLLAVAIGGLMDGVGIGLIFLTNSTSGGTDMVSAILHKFFKHYSVPTILFVVDGLIVVLGAFVLGFRNAMYGIITIYVLTKISDTMLEGVKFAKLVYIISDEYEKIASLIMSEMDRGVTAISARGMYTNKDKSMLFCVVGKKEIVKIKEIAAVTDPKSLIIVSDVREVFGEGFVEYSHDSAVK
ncbi:hypothetical protein GCWU000282_03097 [Catonella morbi ATCC 51271]|jgi:hypothetical protein|uniref:DUF2179 domain-containing protein n=1 Tax=Catonella morbi ATCC 51271 TaxID=592026 RepID=V2Z4F7_9FIRM|nr:YitT family protein [Catonella morbi]ESL01800.1 hypothetical protein GCWU000282_03097 [Catonella morbi ATCC 51271]